MSKIIKAGLDYINGYLRYAHFELELSDKEYEEFSNLSEEEKKEYIQDNAELILDDYEVNEYGSITKIYE